MPVPGRCPGLGYGAPLGLVPARARLYPTLSNCVPILFPFDGTNFAVQSSAMQSNWAEENLLIIRTLMERSAVYRRALAPIMVAIGVLGVVAAFLAWFLKITAVTH